MKPQTPQTPNQISQSHLASAQIVTTNQLNSNSIASNILRSEFREISTEKGRMSVRSI